MAIKTLPPFQPLRWARGPHAQTILGRYWSRHRLPASAERHELTLKDNDRVVIFHRPASDLGKAVIYLFHGLGGSTDADYMPRTAEVFAKHGHPVVLTNHRGCGPGAGLAAGPYHSGRTEDLSAVIAWGRARYPKAKHLAIGFSLSANAVLLLVGAHQHLPQPDAAIAVSAPIELERASDLLAVGFNRIYDVKFVRDCRREIEHRFTQGLIPKRIEIPWHAYIRDVDDLYTAPASGFDGRKDYYTRCSAALHLEKVVAPTVALTAADDPFVDVTSYRNVKVSPKVRLHIEDHGGHMGFLADSVTELGTRHWLDLALLRHAETLLEKV